MDANHPKINCGHGINSTKLVIRAIIQLPQLIRSQAEVIVPDHINRILFTGNVDAHLVGAVVPESIIPAVILDFLIRAKKSPSLMLTPEGLNSNHRNVHGGSLFSLIRSFQKRPQLRRWRGSILTKRYEAFELSFTDHLNCGKSPFFPEYGSHEFSFPLGLAHV
jgi:hypothetical protein